MTYLTRLYQPIADPDPAARFSPRWINQHTHALADADNPHRALAGCERAIVDGLKGWLHYADAYKVELESGIGNDYVLGDEWFAWGCALRGLLNGPTGRLDCGTIDGILVDTLTAEGWDCDMAERVA